MRYKVGDRIFYKDYYNNIHSDIVLRIKEETSEDIYGKLFHYQDLIIKELERGYVSIENYNCIPYKDSRIVELRKKYIKFDKNREKILNDLLKVLEEYDDLIKEEAVKLLTVKIKNSK